MAYQVTHHPAPQHPTRSSEPPPWRTAALGASYLYVRAKVRQAEEQNPPAGQFVEVDGVRLHYIEKGSGPS